MSWEGGEFVDQDGENWPLDFAAKMLSMPEKDLRDLVRIAGLEPAGVIRMAGFRRQGRAPRAYPAEKLILLAQGVADLRETLTMT